MDVATLITTEALIDKYAAPVPRYTSYPTAVQFTPAVGAATHAAWLAALPDDAALSLYIHVPFCAVLCLYCGCHTAVARSEEPRLAYGATLLREINLVAAAIGRRLRVSQIHWGGGTPTALPAGRMIEVVERLHRHFALDADAEMALELDPRTLDDATLATLREIGINRASLGVQDFDPVVQQAVNRVQPYAMVADCVDKLRGMGVRSLNLDLMYGLPHQSIAGVARSAELAAGLDPDRLALFGYAHVPWMKKHQALLPEAALPDSYTRFRQRESAEATLEAAGYRIIGLDHFARAEDRLGQAHAGGALHRNFQGYTTDACDYLVGFGASSISSFPQGHVQNHAATPPWRDAVAAGRLPTARGVAVSPDDRLRGEIIERLMCDLEADIPAIAARHGADAGMFAAAWPALEEQAGEGLVQWDGARLRITARGRPFMRSVAVLFDAHFQGAPRRHATGV